MDSLSAFEGAGWGHVSHSLYATVRSGPGPSTPTSLFLKTCRETIQAGPARERERSSRQDSRDLSNTDTNNVSGILPAGFAGLSLAGKLPQGRRPDLEVGERVLRRRVLEEAVDVAGVDLVDVAVAEARFAVLVDEQGADAFAEVGV